MTTGEKISLIRKANNLNQLEMSDLLGVKQSTLSQIENDKLNISVTSLEVLANKFKISANWLLDSTKSEEDIDLYHYKRRLKIDTLFSKVKYTEIEDNNDGSSFKVSNNDHSYSNTALELELVLELNYKRLIILNKQILTFLNFFSEKKVNPLNKDEMKNLFQIDIFANGFNINNIEDEKLRQYIAVTKTHIWTMEEYISTLIDSLKLEINKPIKSLKEL